MNICVFWLKAVGNKDSISKLKEWMSADYNYWQTPDGQTHVECSADRHFFRLGDVHIEEEDENSAVICGNCAYAVKYCMFENSPLSYYSARGDMFSAIRKSIDMVEATRALGLTVEIYSSESETCFSEHIVVKNGEIVTDQFTDYHEYSLEKYNSKEEAEEELKTTISDSEWNAGGYITRCEWFPWKFSI